MTHWQRVTFCESHTVRYSQERDLVFASKQQKKGSFVKKRLIN